MEDGSQQSRDFMVRSLLKVQQLNQKYRERLQSAYELSSDSFSDSLLNSKTYCIVTDGFNWSFLCYTHCLSSVSCSLIHYLKVSATDFLQTLYKVVKATINLCCDVIYNKYVVASKTQQLNFDEDYLN